MIQAQATAAIMPALHESGVVAKRLIGDVQHAFTQRRELAALMRATVAHNKLAMSMALITGVVVRDGGAGVAARFVMLLLWTAHTRPC